MEKMEKQLIPATKRKRSPATILTVTSPGQAALSLIEAAASGDELATYIALRQRLAAEIDKCRNRRHMASLSACLADVVGRIEQLERIERGQQRGQPASNDDAVERARRNAAGAAEAAGAVKDELL
jgi:hypothetical protein